MDTQIIDHADRLENLTRTSRWTVDSTQAFSRRDTLRLNLYSDRSLIVSAQGDGPHARRAAQMLLDRHAGLIRVIALEYAPDPAMVEDVEQECRFHLLMHLDAYNPERPLKPWLQTVIRNCARNFRRRARRWRLTLMEEDAPEVEAGGEPPLEQLGDQERLDVIQRQVAELPSLYRQVVLRRYFSEESCEEIATDLHLPVGTVKNRLFRARRLLEAKLAAVADAEPSLGPRE